MKNSKEIGNQYRVIAFSFHLVLVFAWNTSSAQQILWAKLFTLPGTDKINCITNDGAGNIYAGGQSSKEVIFPGGYRPAVVYRLDENGDTLFSKQLGFYGEVAALVLDYSGMLRIALNQSGPGSNSYKTLVLSMTPDGWIFKVDTLADKKLTVKYGMMGKDSSLILVGQKNNDINNNWRDMFFQRIQKDGTVDPYISLNPNHPDCGADRVEQLPNGKYLVSGHVGSRVAAYTLDEDGGNPSYEFWYQTPDLSYLYSGQVSRINGQRYMIAAEGGPSIVGQYDSLLNKYWLKKEVGTQIPPQAMTDGSVVYGYGKGVPPYQVFYRVGIDSNYIWNMPIRDSLVARGLVGNLRLKCFTYFEDQSAVVAGYYNGGTTTTTQEDPFFIKISNIGIPVTSLIKPKKGPLANETLAPWPNPTRGTLYLKQYFDKAEIHLYNLAGKEMGEYRIGFGQPIEISGHESGVYLYRAMIDGKFYSGKIIRN